MISLRHRFENPLGDALPTSYGSAVSSLLPYSLLEFYMNFALAFDNWTINEED